MAPQMQQDTHEAQQRQAALLLEHKRRLIEKSTGETEPAPTRPSWRETQAARSEAIKREKEQALVRERENERQITADANYLKEEWALYSRTRCATPPELLPLELANELPRFKALKASTSMRTISAAAFERFEAGFPKPIAKSLAAFERLKSHVASSLRSFFGLFKANDEYEITVEPPSVKEPASTGLSNAARFLRSVWSSKLNSDAQGVIGFHQTGGVTYLHIGSGRHGSVYIRLPIRINSAPASISFLKRIGKAIKEFIPNDGVLAAIDGSFQEANLKQVFEDRIVVRSQSADTTLLARNIRALMVRESMSPENTAILSALPASVLEQEAIFGTPDHWEVWREVSSNWNQSAGKANFESSPSVSKDDVLRSLCVKQNVIIIVAHADEQVLYLPSPPPEGSTLSTDDVKRTKDEIAANGPLVYLFCCESAQTGDFTNLAGVLLDCGAVGVIAPQVKINANKYQALFERLLITGRSLPPLANLQQAEKSVDCRDMEAWLG